MLEQITGEMVTADQQPAPKNKLASMKKKKTMDTELRSNVPVSKVKKEDEDFVNAMDEQYKNKAADAAKYRLKMATMSKKK